MPIFRCSYLHLTSPNGEDVVVHQSESFYVDGETSRDAAEKYFLRNQNNKDGSAGVVRVTDGEGASRDWYVTLEYNPVLNSVPYTLQEKAKP